MLGIEKGKLGFVPKILDWYKVDVVLIVRKVFPPECFSYWLYACNVGVSVCFEEKKVGLSWGVRWLLKKERES